jgi:hypothetical protein
VRLPTFAEHRKFCEVDGWQPTSGKPGRTTGKHFTYIKVLPSGDVLWTNVSRGRGRYHDRDLWSAIRSRQLRVSEHEFWGAVEHATPPSRGATPHAASSDRIPYNVARTLLGEAGYSQSELQAMSRDQAIEAFDHWHALHERRPGTR